MLHSGWFHSALWPKWFHHIHIFIIIIIWITPYQYIYYHHAHQYVAWLFASLFVIFLSLRGEWTSIASNHLVLISSKSHINIMHWALSNGGNGGRFFSLLSLFVCVWIFCHVCHEYARDQLLVKLAQNADFFLYFTHLCMFGKKLKFSCRLVWGCKEMFFCWKIAAAHCKTWRLTGLAFFELTKLSTNQERKK